MRKTIALSLAFAMILSVLPMNAFASSNVNEGQPSGSLWERSLGPATNVRNLGGGTVVASQKTMNAVSLEGYNVDHEWKTTFVAAPGNNLRSILASADYFAGRTTTNNGETSDYVASVRLNLFNANGFVGSVMPSLWNGGRNNPGTLSTNMWQRFGSDVDRMLGLTEGTTYKAIGSFDDLPGGNLFNKTYDPNDLDKQSGFINFVEAVQSSSDREELAFYVKFLAENYGVVSPAALSVDGTLPSGRSTTWPGGPTRPEWEDSNGNGFLPGQNTQELDRQLNAARNQGAGIGPTYREMMGYGVTLEEIEGQMYLLAAFLLPVWEQPAGSSVRMSHTQADLILVRSSLNLPRANARTMMTNVPIEFVTSSATNSNPVYLTFQTKAGWPAAGQSGMRTDLTSVAESRFDLSLRTLDNDEINSGSPKYFHRYGRADIDPIRIKEASQSAFDRQNWWVEINIVTPGFYWAQQSTDIAQHASNPRLDSFQTRYQTQGETSLNNTGRDIRPLTFHGASRTPVDGTNRYRTLSFPLSMGGVLTNENRMINDWFQVSGLSIAADDRARNGDVEVKVELWNTVRGAGSSATGHWSWHPSVLDSNGIWVESQYYIQPPVNFPVGAPNSNADSVRAAQSGGSYTWDIADSNDPNWPSWNGAAGQYRGEFRWNQSSAGNTGSWVRDGVDPIWDGTLVVAKYGQIGLDLYRHDKDDLNDFQLRSGMMDWGYIGDGSRTNETLSTGINNRYGTIRAGDEPNEVYHETARVVLEEQVPGSLPATGAHPTTYTFHEGIQVLGAHFWTNDAPFIEEFRDDDAYVWYGQQVAEADNFLNASINRNTLTIRPEMGEIESIDGNRIRRYNNAQIIAQFYLSIRPGFEYLFGEDIDVTVTSGTVESPFSGSETIALAWDPIMVDTDVIVLDDSQIEAAFGIVRGVPVNDITVTETRAGELLPGSQIWLGVEGGSSRGWNPADSISLSATEVTIVGDTQMQVSQPRLDSHGVYVEVVRPAREDGAQVVFSGVEISGRVVPEQEYNIIVAGDAIAANWSEFMWLREGGGVAVRNTPHGFFIEEPYATPAFAFKGTDIYQPMEPPTVTTPDITNPSVTPPQTPNFAPITLSESTPSYTSQRTGETFQGPPLILVPNIEDPSFQTSYVMFAVMADLLGIDGQWDAAQQIGTFTDGNTTVSLSNGATSAQVNGVPREIRTALGSTDRPGGLRADARIINDRFYVPITFFSYVVTEFPIMVQWNGGNPGSRSVTVMPRP